MQERKARIRLEDKMTKVTEVKCWLAQGSPLSPILFLIYLAEVLIHDTEHRFEYADDLCIYRVGHTLEGNSALLGQDLQQILNWGMANKVSFDPEKSELMHFTRANDHTLNQHSGGSASGSIANRNSKNTFPNAVPKPTRWCDTSET